MGSRKTKRNPTAQSLSLGQWCAISGAAASTGMGRQTHLGYALAMSFANVRLGYWWSAPQLGRQFGRQDRKTCWESFRFWLLTRLPTFTYLYNELTARYSREFDRQYLSDGGHFENTGAYALIKRRIPLILVSDNGQDSDYAFADLESLVRLVRLDEGGEVQILGGKDLAQFLKRKKCTEPTFFIDPEQDPDWQDKARAGGSPSFALAMRITFSDEDDEKAQEPIEMIWIKPSRLSRLPQDVAVYGRSHADFPQQSTGNQFFDEAQWESYRRLGEEEMTRLLVACPGLLADLAQPSAVT